MSRRGSGDGATVGVDRTGRSERSEAIDPAGGDRGRTVDRRHVLGLVGAASAALAGCQTATRDGEATTSTPGEALEGSTSAGPSAGPGTASGPGTGPDGTADGPGGDATGDASPYTRVYREARAAVAVVQTDTGQGSCFAYDDEGHFVTNHHVIAGANEIHLHFSRDDWRSGSVVGSDVYSDLAVLSVADPPGYVHPQSVIDGSPAVGQEVVVLGTPFGFQGSLTTGVVSGLDRALDTATGFPIPGTVQTDAAVNPGNSGGPMLTLDARVAGVVSAGGGENIAFGIPPQLVNRVIPALRADGEYDHPYMGVTLLEVDPAVADANGLDEPTGVIVASVVEGGPADGTLQGSETRFEDGRQVPVGGDVIVGLDGRTVTSMAHLSTYLAFQTSPGDTLSVRIHRDGSEETVGFELGERPDPSL